MGRVLVTSKALDEYEKKDRIGYPGREGSCYILNEKEVIKIFHILDKKRKVYFDNLKCNNISFPKDIYILNDLVVGYTMDYLTGNIISKFGDNLEIQKLKQMYIDMKNIIESYPDIYMDDICLVNILFDFNNNCINLIDTSRWYPEENAYCRNISKFDKVLNYVLCGRTLDWLHQYNDKSQDLFSMYRFYKLGYHVPFLELLEAIQYEVEEKFGQSVKTIGDLGWKNK